MTRLTTTGSQVAAEAIDLQKERKLQRLFFADNLRSFLTVMVVVFHVGLTYGALHGWYYYEPSNDQFIKRSFTIFATLSRAFVLDLFFFISGYFTPGAYDKRGTGFFVKDRLIRLGIPLFIFAFIIRPTLVYILNPGYASSHSILGNILSLDNVGTGPLWFVEALLIFSFVYVLLRWVWPKGNDPEQDFDVPGTRTIIAFCVSLALVTFALRFFYPFGKQLFHLRIGLFPAHIAFFTLGIIAYRRNWLMKISGTMAKRWTWVAATSVALFFPAFISQGLLAGKMPLFNGGFHWQALSQTAWEAFYSVSVMIALLFLFREKFNKGGSIGRMMAANAYAVFVIHAPIVTLFCYSIRTITLYPLAKFAVASVLAVTLCFLTSHFIVRRLPYARKVL